jgi:hypothetical protein
MAHKDFVSSLTTRLSVVRLSFVVFSGFAIYLEITTDIGVYIREFVLCGGGSERDVERLLDGNARFDWHLGEG